MKLSLYAVIAACFAMMSTSGLLALATAAPAPQGSTTAVTSGNDVEGELEAYLDVVLQRQLDAIKASVK